MAEDKPTSHEEYQRLAEALKSLQEEHRRHVAILKANQDELKESVELHWIHTMAHTAIEVSDQTALVALCEAVGKRLGVTNLDGLSLLAWYEQQRLTERERTLRDWEDMDPAAAALVQQRVDEAKAKMHPPDRGE